MRISVASGRGVAERWRSQYLHPKEGWGTTALGNSKDIYERLCALGPSPDPDAVAEIIGNKGWAHLQCTACGEYVRRAVDLTPPYKDEALLLCEPCVGQARAAFEEAAARAA